MEDESGKPEEPKPTREEEEDGEAQDRRLAFWGIDLLGLSARVRNGTQDPLVWH